MIHPEIAAEVDKIYRQLVISHWHTFKQPDGAMTLYKYAKKIAGIQAEIDTIKLKQEIFK
jgi:hypothetical protein